MAPDDMTAQFHLFRDEDPKERYSFEVHRSISGPAWEVVGRDYILGQWASYRIDEEALHSSPEFDGYHFALQQVARQLDFRRRVLVGKLLRAEEAALLDEQAVYAVDTVLSVLRSKNERFARWPTHLDPDKAENFKELREHLDEPSYTSWKMKLRLMGKKVVYTEMDWRIAKDCLEALAEVERQLPF